MHSWHVFRISAHFFANCVFQIKTKSSFQRDFPDFRLERSREQPAFLGNVAVIDAKLNQHCSNKPYYEGYVFRGEITRGLTMNEIDQTDRDRFDFNHNIER